MKPKLQHYRQFQEILSSYHVSDRARQALEGLKLVLMVAPTSTGRNTLIRHLIKTGSYHYVVSDTTRPPRINDGVMEENGKEYWFRSEEDMLKDLKSGEFLEAELIHDQQVSGISIRELLNAKQEGKVAVTDIELQGIHNIVRVKPDTVSIMLLPPSYEEWQKRITRRGHMSREEYSRRLATAYRIFTDGVENNYYHFVIADNVDQTASIIDSLVKGGPNPHQDRGKELVRRLQVELQDKTNPSA
jgi:guanylate kinase